MNDIKISKETLSSVIECSKTPQEVFRNVMRIKGISRNELAKITGKRRDHIDVSLWDKTSLGVKMCYEISKALKLDPVVLNRINADVQLKNYIKKLKTTTKK